MATMNLSLPDPMRQWVETQVQSGHYSNGGDYVRDLIRRNQEHQDRREALIQALIEGERSGQSERTLAGVWKAVKARQGLDKTTQHAKHGLSQTA